MTAVTDALVVLIPAGAHPVTATVSPTTNGASIPDGNPNLIAADALVTGIVPINYGSSGFESSQSGGVTIGVGSSDKATAAITGELRRVVKVAVRASGKTHISEVQITGDF